jgi:predicted DNA-binding protein (UPF0278 family)
MNLYNWVGKKTAKVINLVEETPAAFRKGYRTGRDKITTAGVQFKESYDANRKKKDNVKEIIRQLRR